jgi:hypothetical protein
MAKKQFASQTATSLAKALYLQSESRDIFVTSLVSHFTSLGLFLLLKVFLNNVVIEEDGV